jgi:hypothetical protein
MPATVVSNRQISKIIAPVLANPTATSETVVAKFTLPSNYLTAGLGMLVNASLLSAGTGTVIWRLRIGSVGTTADTLVTTITTSAAQVANARGTVFFNIYTPSTTTMNASGHSIMQNAILGMVTGALVNATVVPTSPIFISITAQLSVASANVITGAGIQVNN